MTIVREWQDKSKQERKSKERLEKMNLARDETTDYND